MPAGYRRSRRDDAPSAPQLNPIEIEWREVSAATTDTFFGSLDRVRDVIIRVLHNREVPIVRTFGWLRPQWRRHRRAPGCNTAGILHQLIPPPEPSRVDSATQTVRSGPASGRSGSVLRRGRALGVNAPGIRAYMLWILFETLWPVLCTQGKGRSPAEVALGRAPAGVARRRFAAYRAGGHHFIIWWCIPCIAAGGGERRCGRRHPGGSPLWRPWCGWWPQGCC